MVGTARCAVRGRPFDFAQGRLRAASLPRGFCERNAAQDRHHQETTNYSKRGHEIEIVFPALVEKRSEEVASQTSAEILEGIDYARSEAGHFCAADVHGGRRSEDGMSRVGGKRDENEKKDRCVHAMKLCCGENDERFEKIKTGRQGRAATLKNFVGNEA